MSKLFCNPFARTIYFFALTMAVAACGGHTVTPQIPNLGATAARSLSASRIEPSHYTVTDLGTLGGGFSAGRSLNNRASVTGISQAGNDLTCCDVFLWRDGVMRNLGNDGTLGSTTNEDHGINDRDQIVGWLEPRVSDPNREHFCFQPENSICIPFVWRSGVFTHLQILNGHNANAFAINASGMIVGAAEGARDTSCPPPQVYHFAAVLWSNHGAITVLPPVSGDSDAQPFAINDRGDAAGTSGSCTAGPIRAVVWRNGSPSVLPSLGGATFNIALAINNKGDAAGQSDLPGDATHHAVLWHNGAVTDLGTINGLPASLANATNDRDQVVGFSQDLDGSNTVAELWQNGGTWDLNKLIPPHSGLFLIEALDINNRGEITGYALDSKTQSIHGFLLTPSQRNTFAQPGFANGMTDAVLPADVQATVRELTQNRFWHRRVQ